MSRWSDEVPSGARVSTNAMARVDGLLGQRNAARPSDREDLAPWPAGSCFGSAGPTASSPIGFCSTAPTPPSETTMRSFCHSATWTSAGIEARIPALSRTREKAQGTLARRFGCRARRSRTVWTAPTLRIRPGRDQEGERRGTGRPGPARARGSPPADPRASTPFCSGTTKRVASEHRAQRAPRLFDLPGLHAQQHDVDRSRLGGIVGRDGGPDADLALRSLHGQAGLADRLQVRAARDEHHLLAAAGQEGAEAPARPAHAEDRDPHGLRSTADPAGSSPARPSRGSPRRPWRARAGGDSESSSRRSGSRAAPARPGRGRAA